MITLDDKIWKVVEGGYKIPYNPSLSLKKLWAANNPLEIKEFWEEFWNELHHQGDVGLASYLTVPELVKYCKQKKIFEWNPVGLCIVIEQQRVLGDNPELPIEFQDYYIKGLRQLKEFALENIDNCSNKKDFMLTFSTIATCSNEQKLGKAIMEMMDEYVFDDFLDQF